MNLDLIIKLVKLANNNPNDHEANLAARKACRLIEDGKFEFNGTHSYTERANVRQPSPADIFSEFFRKAGARNPYNWYHEDVREAEEAYRKEQYARRAREEAQAHERQAYNRTYNPYANYDPYTGKKKEPPKEKRDVKCTKCGKVYKTGYVGNLFVCNTCHWDKYHEEERLKEQRKRK